MRNTAQTHLVDGDARSVVLPIVPNGRNAGAQTVTVKLPSSTNVLPNGPYLLFANQNPSLDATPGHVIPSIGMQVFAEGTNTGLAPTISTTAPPPHAGSTASKALAGKAIASNALPSKAQTGTAVANGVAGSNGSGSGGSALGASTPQSVGATQPAPVQGLAAPQPATLLPAARTRSADSSVGAWAALGGALLLAVALLGYSGRRRRHQVA
jgi:hypothetical protein